MSHTESPPDSDARDRFLNLRREAEMPPGGEIVVKSEVVTVAEAVGIDVQSDWTKPFIVFSILDEVKPHGIFTHVEGSRRERFEYTKQDHVARDFHYLQSSEAERIAEYLAEQEDDPFIWNDG